MRGSAAGALGAAAFATLVACAAPAPAGADSAAPDTGDPADTGVSGPVALGDANNYRYVGTLDAPTVPTASGADLLLDWSALASDLQCHAVDPVGDIDNVALLAFPRLTEAEVEAGLADDALEQAELGGYVSLEPGDRTSVQLSELGFFGTDVDIETLVAEGSGTWLLLLTTGADVGVGARALAFLQPSAAEAATEVRLGDACGILDFDADLSSLAPVRVPAAGPWVVEWSGLATDGHGQPVDARRIDRAMLARYDALGVADLEARFLDLEALADGLWTVTLDGGSAADLADLADADGAPFPGFDAGADATWILALRCSLCANPAPVFLTVIAPG